MVGGVDDFDVIIELYAVIVPTFVGGGVYRIGVEIFEPIFAEYSYGLFFRIQYVTQSLKMRRPILPLVKILKEFAEVARVLHEPYRSRAYETAIVSLLPLPYIDEKILPELPIGDSIRAKINEYLLTGEIKELYEARTDPIYLKYKMFDKILGVGPAQIRKWVDAGLTPETIPESELTRVQRIGFQYHRELRPIPRDIIGSYVGGLHLNKFVEKWEIAGSYRRGSKYSGDCDILVIGDMTKLCESLQKSNEFIAEIMSGHERFTYLCRHHGWVMQVDILAVPEEDWIPALLYLTGSRYFNEYMRGVARSKGYRLNQHGLYKDGERVNIKSEEDIFKILDLEWIPPEKR